MLARSLRKHSAFGRDAAGDHITVFSNDNVAFSFGASAPAKKQGKVGMKHCKPAISIGLFKVFNAGLAHVAARQAKQ